MSVDARLNMVELQLVRRGIAEPRLLAAFRGVPRDELIWFDETSAVEPLAELPDMPVAFPLHPLLP
jgi:hypothetical protein